MTFDTEHAKKYGVDESILLNNFIFWIKKNKANKRHYYDGRYWTYNSIKAFSELFDFWSEKQLNRIIKSLCDQKIIITGNYNTTAFDRTIWYALVDESLFLGTNKSISKDEIIFEDNVSQTGGIDLTKRGNGFSQTGTSFTDSKTDSKTINNIVEYLNLKSKKKFNKNNKSAAAHISARLREGFTLDDFYRVIDHKCSQWLNDEKMQMYLRPETLFGNKFDGYLNESPKVNPQSEITFDDRDQYCLPPSALNKLYER